MSSYIEELMSDRTPGVRIAERLLVQPGGATMHDIVAATGGPQYNVLRTLEGRGFRIRKVKEGRLTRYFAEAPEDLTVEATMTSQGQVTVPKLVRERLGLRSGGRVRFTLTKEGKVVVAPAHGSIRDFFGILGKPRRRATLDDMDRAIGEGAVARYRRSAR